MAYMLLKSRNAVQNLKTKVGFCYLLCRSSCSIPFTHHPTFHSRKHKIPAAFQEKRPTLFTLWRAESVEVQKELDPLQNIDDSRVLNHPGGKIKFTSNLDFLPASNEERIYCYRVLDDNGQLIPGNIAQITKEVAVKMYSDMAVLQTMDAIFYEAQRQGRISFYVTTTGEEAINVASAAALQMDDLVFPQVKQHVHDFAFIFMYFIFCLSMNLHLKTVKCGEEQFCSEHWAIKAYLSRSTRKCGQTFIKDLDPSTNNYSSYSGSQPI